jgi:WS/DGAT/MGAT family acyltransferase
MGAVDAAFLYGETPSWHMHVSAVMIADPSRVPGGFSVEELKRRTEKRLHLAPQFRWRLVDVPFGLDRPGWIEDPDFDIDAHIRRIGVPAPGGPEQVGNLIGDLVSLKLDRRKPLWEFWVIEGLEDGRIAILAKIHHSIIDGVSGSELASVLLDLEPDPPETPPPAHERAVEQEPSQFELIARGIGDTMLTPWRIARLAGQSVKQGLTFLGFQRQRQSPAAPFQAPRTSFNTELTPHRRFAYSSVPLDDIKGIKWAFDVKVNDVVLALCSGALRRYLLEHDELPHAPLIAQVPVSLRTDDDKSDVGTKVGAMFASLATDVSDPALRLLSINDSTRSAKEMQRALAADKIMGLTEAAPPGLISLAARMYTAAQLDRRTPPIMNLIISNVPGPPFPLFCAGAEIEALYPMGPLLYGTGVNVTVFSYRDRVDFGFMTCREAVDDGWFIAEGIPLALEELKLAAEAVQV